MTNAPYIPAIPAPWCYFENNEGWSVEGPNEELIAYCDYDLESEGYSPAETHARMIAALPNLLQGAEKALVALQGNYDKYDKGEWHDADSRDAYIALRDAVNMAKGGSK